MQELYAGKVLRREMKMIKEYFRYAVVQFAIGFILGTLMDCTINKSLEVNVVVSVAWGIVICIVSILHNVTDTIIKEKNSIRKEEYQKIISELDTEINELKLKIPNIISSGKSGDMSLAGIYLDRIIELEKLKKQYECNIKKKESR